MLALSLLGIGCANAPERTSTSVDAITSCVTLVALGDTMLSNPPMNQNFGALPILRAGGKDESLVQFALGSIPSAAAINSATLKLYISGSDSTSPVNAHRVTVPWAETSTTFATFGQHYDPALLGAIVTTSVNVQKSVDLTAQVRSWLTGAQPNYGILLETSSAKKTIFVSREGGTGEQKPQLQVCYTTPDDHCSPNPCVNGSTCENGATSYTCHCTPGYSGATCATVIDNCASNPCLNGGACASAVGSYTCTCPLGYTGANCETLVDNCASAPCQNGGTCGNGVGTYTCSCPAGYTGANCETLVNNCAANPCQNGATCMNSVGSYSCTCATGFTGTNCEINIDDCASAPCHNGGTCIDGVASYTCSCPPDWGGATCDVNLSTCSQNPCLNGATCTNGFGTYTCGCAAGYTGTNCEIDINECASNPCLDGGVCIDGVASYTCSCPIGYVGANCQTAVPVADLGVTISGPATANVSTNVSYTVTVMNYSTTTMATSPIVQISYHGGSVALAYYSVPGGYCNIGSGANCFLGSLAPGASVSFSLTGIATTIGPVEINATVSSSVQDPNASNNSASLTLVGTAGPNLSITMTAPASVEPNSSGVWSFAYTITVQNTGGGASGDAVVQDDMPTWFGQYHASASSTAGSCTVALVPGAGSFTYHDQVRCDLGPVAPGETATITISESFSDGGLSGPVGNTALLLAAVGYAPSASATILFGAADGSIAVSGPSSGAINTNLVYSVTATNNGPLLNIVGTYTYVNVSGATLVSAPGCYVNTSTGASCPVWNLLRGTPRTFAITISAASAGTATVSAQLDVQNYYDTNTANNSAAVSTTIN